MAEQEQNRSEPATPYKLTEAQKEGQVAKSMEFNSFVIVGALALVLFIRGPSVVRDLCGLWVWLFQACSDLRLEHVSDGAWLGKLLVAALELVVPFAVVAVILAVLVNLLQTGPILTFLPLRPKFERINPLEGFKRVFSKKMLFEGIKTVLKLAFFGSILYSFLLGLWPGLPSVATTDTGVQTNWLAIEGKTLLVRLGLAMLVVGVLDLAYVRWQFRRQMMMSRREVKEEIKRREGDPLVRAKLRELQKENLKQARSLSRVPEADVLITNPDHFAIALKYVRGEMTAPYVIAKGADAWAADMKALARRHEVPLFERKRLARHLFRRAQLDRPVPPDSFVDVARVYADIEMERRRAARYEVAR